MPRDVQIRDGYQNDIAYLSRLARAIEKDPKLSAQHKNRIRRKVNDLIVSLIGLDGKGE